MQAGERLVFYDLETAGLASTSSIIQIAAIAVNSQLQELETFEVKIRFDVSQATPEALRINSFEPTVWKRLAMQPEDAAKSFANFLRRHATVDMVSRSGKPYQLARLVAHNASFDGPLLISWFADLGLFLPAARSVYCTLQRAYWMFQEDRQLTPPTNYKLGTLCEYFGIPLPDNEAHDALADVRGMVDLYRGMNAHTNRQTVAA